MRGVLFGNSLEGTAVLAFGLIVAVTILVSSAALGIVGMDGAIAFSAGGLATLASVAGDNWGRVSVLGLPLVIACRN